MNITSVETLSNGTIMINENATDGFLVLAYGKSFCWALLFSDGFFMVEKNGSSCAPSLQSEASFLI